MLSLQHVWSESEDCLPFLQLAQDYISSCGKKTLLEVLEKVFTSFRPVRNLTLFYITPFVCSVHNKRSTFCCDGQAGFSVQPGRQPLSSRKLGSRVKHIYMVRQKTWPDCGTHGTTNKQTQKPLHHHVWVITC